MRKILSYFATAIATLIGAPALAQTTVTVTPGDTVLSSDWSNVLSNIGIAGVGIIGVMVAVTGLRYLLAVLK